MLELPCFLLDPLLTRILTKPGTNPAGFLFIGASLKTANETIEAMNLEMEISRLRLIIGDLRETVYNQTKGLGNPDEKYNKETDKLMYGEQT